jgi:hypothetical protein
VDFFDPDTWKLPASLIGYWQTIIVGTGAILAAIGALFRWGLKPFQWGRAKFARTARSANVERTLRFVQDEQQSFWGTAGRGNEMGTQVAGRWRVTNTSDRNIFLLRARLDGHASPADHVITEGGRGIYSSRHAVPAHQMANVSVHFMLFPPIASGTEPLVADVIFTDNLENEHRVRARFRSIQRPAH